MLNADPLQSATSSIASGRPSENRTPDSAESSFRALGADTAIVPAMHRQGRKLPNKISTKRAIWNSLAVASMITLIGFALLSLKLNQDLSLARVELQRANSQFRSAESQPTEQDERYLTYQEQLRDYENQTSLLQTQYAELKAEQLTLQTEKNRATSLTASLVEENNRLAELRMVEKTRLDLVSVANRSIIMYGTEFAPSLQGAFYLRDYTGVIVIHGLEPLLSAQNYQLWLQTEDGNQIPANLITVHSSQEAAWTEITLSPNTPYFVSASISIEPIGGSTTPTGPMILASELVPRSATN